MSAECFAELKKILKSDEIITDEGQRREKSTDLYALRMYQRHIGWETTLPKLLLRPQNEDSLQKILEFANKEKIAIIPYGGGSGVLGGAECRSSAAITVDLSLLNEVGQINERDLTITVGAGVYIKDLEKMLNDKGYCLGHYPQSMDLAQMGGLVSTRSIGQFSTGYGGIEDLLIGMKGLLPNGHKVEFKVNPRKAAGPDLRHLFLGGEGALGIVTEVTVKIFPCPASSYKEAFRVKSMEQGFEIIRKIMREGIKPSVVRLHDWLECEKPYGQFMEEDECLLLFRSDGNKEITDAHAKIIQKIAKENNAISAGFKPVDVWFEHKNDAAVEYEDYALQGILVDTIEISANWENISKIYYETIDTIYYDPEITKAIMFASGHSSHSYMNGTNIYFQFGAMPSPDATVEDIERLHRRLWDVVMEQTLKYGGSIAHHHGVGKHRVKYIKDELGSSYEILQTIKRAFDPNKIMNPGALIEE